ncbi:MAG: histidine kinase [Leptolyngbyaceae cyanobacterium CSU_1_4]|nr:histidine kinase [Leptolyngbyaceae cyanobacterium CSU_1_4]
MPSNSCHIIVEGNLAIIYASRNGSPHRMLPILIPFLNKFWQERETSGERVDTPECLVAQIIVRFGFEICEDDYSNLRVGVNYYRPDAAYLYQIGADRKVRIWVPDSLYLQNPSLGLAGCCEWIADPT